MMAGFTLIHAFMVKAESSPVGDAVAVGTFTFKVIGVKLSGRDIRQIFWLLIGVAGAAFDWCTGIHAVAVAVFTFQGVVATRKGEFCVIDVLAQE